MSNLILFDFPITALQDTMPLYKYLKVFKVRTYYKTLISHESWCSNSRQEEVWEQRDGAKWEGVWNWNIKCCCSPV